jgi:hypothetical protein
MEYFLHRIMLSVAGLKLLLSLGMTGPYVCFPWYIEDFSLTLYIVPRAITMLSCSQSEQGTMLLKLIEEFRHRQHLFLVVLLLTNIYLFNVLIHRQID